MVEIPTQNDCTEGDHLFVLAIIVESQVPQTHIQVLNKHSLVLDQGLDAAALPRGLHHTPLLFAIQTLHEIILQGGKTKWGKKKENTNKQTPKQTDLNIECFSSKSDSLFSPLPCYKAIFLEEM